MIERAIDRLHFKAPLSGAEKLEVIRALRKAKKDRDRLDYLERLGKDNGFFAWNVQAWGALVLKKRAIYTDQINPRKAIDAAMRSERKIK